MDAVVGTTLTQASREALLPEAALALKSRRQALILGRGSFAKACWQLLRQDTRMADQVIGFVDDIEAEHTEQPIVGNLAELPTLVERYKVGIIVVCLDDRRARLPMDLLLDLKVGGIEVIDGHRLFEEITGRVPIDSLKPSTLIFSSGFKHHASALLMKRVLDVVIASIGLLVTAPLFLVVAALIKLDSPGPVFYHQSRVGLRSRPFMMTKFRSMVSDAESSGPCWAKENDHRVSRVGRWLRKSRIDEIPQFVNVLKGEMSMVGPRPERPVFVEEFRKWIPYYDIRHSVRPGITGWAQVMCGYGDYKETTHLKFQYDLYYIKNQSLWLDVKTLVKTVRVLATGDGAR